MTLNKEQKVQLSELYQMPGFRVLEEVIKAVQIEKGQQALNSRTEAYTAELRGFAAGTKWVYTEVRDIFQAENKLDNKIKTKS